jgi:diguanylate cyclase (GGDEF)-like protein
MSRPARRFFWRVAAAYVVLFALLAVAPVMAQSLSSTSSVPTPAPVNPRTLLGVATLMVAALLLILYFYRRRLYILYWIAGWILAAASAFIVAREYGNVKFGHGAYGLSQFLAIVSGLVFVVSADAYRTRPGLRRAYGVVLLPVMIWFVLSPIALGADAVYAPGHLMTAAAFAAAGAAHLSLVRQTRLIGAGFVGTMMLLLSASNAWLALEVSDPGSATLARATFANLALHLLTGLGMQLMTFEDMTYELRRTNRRLQSAQGELQEMVTTDALTGCRNRRYFDEVIGREIQRHRRYRIPLSLLFVDIDRFKAINDTLGHEAGDRVLHGVAGFLNRSVRGADYVFRWGGDEFLILISCREDEAERKAAELQSAFAGSPEIMWLPAGVGLSVGCAEVPPDAADVMAVLKVADERMYFDKKRMIGSRL